MPVYVGGPAGAMINGGRSLRATPRCRTDRPTPAGRCRSGAALPPAPTVTLMTEPPRPPGAGDPGYPPPDPTSPGPYPSAEPPTAPLSGAPGTGGYPRPVAIRRPPVTNRRQAATLRPGTIHRRVATPTRRLSPPGGYPAGGAYGAPGGAYGAPGGGYANNEDKTWALVAHFGGALGALVSFGPLGFVAPLIAYLARGNQSPAVRAHALAALNFQILWSIIAFVLLFVSWCLFFLPSIAVVVIQILFGIIAGMKANEGSPYRYPMSATFIK
ncbi:DUF4870 domain-containing protein [Micromonospora sp. M12]